MVEERKGAAQPEEVKGNNEEYEAPQDDVVAEMMSTMETLKAQMDSIKNGALAGRAKRRGQDIAELEAEVMVELLQIQGKIEGVRARLESCQNSPQNLNGCLKGSVNDYLDSFDGQIQKLKARLEQDRSFWRDQEQRAAIFQEN